MACNVSPTTSTVVVPVKAGDTLTTEWHHGLNGADPKDSDDPIAASHKGPMMRYLAKVDDAATASASGLKWFKFFEDGYDATTKKWAVDKMIAAGGKTEMKLPSCLPDGDYLFRAELLALHSAGGANGAQFYMECAQIKVSGGSGSLPTDTVSIPGLYTATDPGILVSIYGDNSEYKIPGPAVMTCGAGGAPTVTSSAGSVARSSLAPIASSSFNRRASSAVPIASSSSSTPVVSSATPVQSSSSAARMITPGAATQPSIPAARIAVPWAHLIPTAFPFTRKASSAPLLPTASPHPRMVTPGAAPQPSIPAARIVLPSAAPKPKVLLSEAPKPTVIPSAARMVRSATSIALSAPVISSAAPIQPSYLAARIVVPSVAPKPTTLTTTTSPISTPSTTSAAAYMVRRAPAGHVAYHFRA